MVGLESGRHYGTAANRCLGASGANAYANEVHGHASQLKCMQLTCATDAPPIKCSGSGASDTVLANRHCEARLNKEV
ncbi:hypothetical protein EVAR_62202_1 [Eumeta japonica]|uniref:Uncharacterized protein n=1 Tax=Eumeta variegata TaxID=151549 RepID=A0A4C1ZZW0_EUMVA|nr:hypothetical protein EVAR_62202_1 [Eumeta japonica]